LSRFRSDQTRFAHLDPVACNGLFGIDDLVRIHELRRNVVEVRGAGGERHLLERELRLFESETSEPAGSGALELSIAAGGVRASSPSASRSGTWLISRAAISARMSDRRSIARR
jgi:hypothetical protein